jgi:hypothetical protein
VDAKVVELDEITAEEFSNKSLCIGAKDFRSKLVEWSPQPQPLQRDRVVSELLAGGSNPPRNIAWKAFHNRVRNECKGWLKAGKPAHGFSDKQIQRVVKELRSKWDI